MIDFGTIKDKIKNIKINRLFYNNKFVAVFSIVTSFVIWIAMASNSSESIPMIISDIPVDIVLSESAVKDGLRIFSGQDITARVEVTGNRLTVGQLTKNDIQVTAPQAASTIMSPGNYTLELAAKKVGLIKDYNIVSDVKPSVITVMVDRYRETEFTIEPEIEFTAKPGCFVGNTVLSTNSVVLSGPETEISKIKKVVVKKNISGEVSDPITLKLPIIMYDAYGQAITSKTITSTHNEIDLNIPVLTKKEVNIVPSFTNVPSGINMLGDYKNIIKASPSKLEIAGPQSEISGLNTLNLEPIDFTSLDIKNNKIILPINLPQNCRSLNNIYSADISVDMSVFKEKIVNINRFSFLNAPSNKKVNVYNNNLNVKIIGPQKSLNNLKSSDIVAQIDLQNKNENINSMEVPIKLKIENYNDLWTNEDYFVNINLTD